MEQLRSSTLDLPKESKGPKRAGGAIGLDSRGPRARRGKLPEAAEVPVKDEPPARPREQGGSAFVITTSHGPWPRFS